MAGGRVGTRQEWAASAGIGGGVSPSRRWLALGVLCVTVLMVNLDNTVLNVALPTLVRVLHAASTQLQWIVDSYIIVYAGLVLAAGSLADRIGRKRTFLAGLPGRNQGHGGRRPAAHLRRPVGRFRPVRDLELR
jgi:hypothetical protein